MGIIGLQASKEVKRMRKESTGDPFINLPDELFLGILTLLPSREVCQLRLQNKYIRNFIDNSEEARSIDIYVRHDARKAEPWDHIPDFSRVDLREALTRLARDYGRLPSRNGYVKVTDAVAKTVLDLWSEPVLTDTFCDESLVLDAFVQLHHVQRLLVDDERKGRFEDNGLCVARNALRSRLLVICGLEREYVWPVDRG
ncbi:hypothetical protein Q7P36_005048 [Cladosporium allicinum]